VSPVERAARAALAGGRTRAALCRDLHRSSRSWARTLPRSYHLAGSDRVQKLV